MSKYQDGFFMQLPRAGFTDGTYTKMGAGAFALYVWLKEYEHNYCGSGNEFYHTDKQIADDMGICETTVRKHRKTLLDVGVIEFARKHIKYKDGSISEERKGCYVIKDGY